MTLGLYVHVPFCVAKCGYCDFVSYPLQDQQVQGFILGLQGEAKYYAHQRGLGRRLVDTVFFGGGTPTCLETENICHIVQILREYFTWHESCEATVEANPGTVTLDKLRLLRKSGINRLSFGVQAFQDELLQRLGRIHRVQEVRASVAAARKAGFDNLSLDLMFGLPGQSLAQWRDTLCRAVDLEPEHLSCYSLKIEPGTAFARDYAQGKIVSLPEELELEMYLWAIDYLQSQGYQQYEISNFARPGYYCQHNLRYWQCTEYLGLGPAAHSYVQEVRWSNTTKLGEYLDLVEDRGQAQVEVEQIDANIARVEYLIMGLRLNQGIQLADFTRRFGQGIETWYQQELDTLSKQGLLKFTDGRMALTAKALPISNLVLEKFV